MADTLTQLRRALADRDDIRETIVKLEREAAASTAGGDKARSKLEKQTERLSSAEKDVDAARKTVTDQLVASRSVVEKAEAELRDLEERHASGEIPDESFDQQREVAQRRASSAGKRAAVREKALQAESAKELNWLARTPVAYLASEDDAQQAEQSKRETHYSDWPGASVPERIVALWRDSRKPHSRRTILVSSIALAVTVVAVIGVILVAGSRNPRDASYFLREDEVLVPVMVDEAVDIRNLDFTLEYDNEALTAISVIQGDVGRLAFMQYDIDGSGRVDVQLRDVTGIDGSGSIVIIRFTVGESSTGTFPVYFTGLSAVDARTIQERPAEGADGWIEAGTLDILAPVIKFP